MKENYGSLLVFLIFIDLSNTSRDLVILNSILDCVYEIKFETVFESEMNIGSWRFARREGKDSHKVLNVVMLWSSHADHSRRDRYFPLRSN